MAILAVLILLVVGFLVPINGLTGWQRVQGMLGMTPAAAPATTAPVVPRYPTQREQEINTVQGRPKVDDRARLAEPLDDLTPRDREGLDRLIDKARKP
ncbi:MAG: hypothetical protein H6706_06125 [Myxococcales bacterium]|nr:hypothetical protein [Myxococcales bacterium]